VRQWVRGEGREVRRGAREGRRLVRGEWRGQVAERGVAEEGVGRREMGNGGRRRCAEMEGKD